MERDQIQTLTTTALMIALVAVATIIIQIPIPGTREYIHPGDAIIFLTAIFFGKKMGAAAGGIGSAMADIITGYSFWAPWTLIIKGVMGFIVGVLSNYEKGKLLTGRNVIAMLLGTALLAFGYFLVAAQMQGYAAALTGVPANLLQGIGGMLLFFLIGYPLDRTNVIK